MAKHRVAVGGAVAVLGYEFATFTFDPADQGPLRCGCDDVGVTMTRGVCECVSCGASWILLAERVGLIEVSHGGRRQVLVYLVPGTEPVGGVAS